MTHSDHATATFQALLAPDREALDVPWASFVGDRTDRETVTVPQTDVEDPLVGIQAFEVGEYGHEVEINGTTLGGFDLPPSAGWQYWVDTVDPDLVETGENTVRIRRADGEDAFAVGTVVLRWRVRDE